MTFKAVERGGKNYYKIQGKSLKYHLQIIEYEWLEQKKEEKAFSQLVGWRE